MKITYQPINFNNQSTKSLRNYNSVPNNISDSEQLYSASQIPFQAIHGIKVKKFDIKASKTKLIKDIDDILAKKNEYDYEYVFNKVAKEFREKFLSKLKKEFLQQKARTPLQQEELKQKYMTEVDNQRDTLKQLYIDGKKLPEITYIQNGTKIRPSMLSNSEYKIEKPDEKIKTFIKSAKQIHQAERNYEVFDNDELQERLLYYSTQKVSEDEEVLEHIVDFSTSKMLTQDKSNLVKLLRLLDDAQDGKITVNELKTAIKEQKIRPTDTDLIKESERKQFIEKQRLEQKANAEFVHYCSKYEDLIDLLRKSGLEKSADMCLLYRPTNIAGKRENTDGFIKLINSYVTKDNKITNPKKLEVDIKYLDKYYQTKLYESDSSILSEAVNFVKQSGKEFNEVEVGQYIKLKEMLDFYPTSVETLSEQEANIVGLIKSKMGSSTEAIKSLIKFDNFRTQDEVEKTKINNILGFFQADKTKSDRDILESIIENIYTQTSTDIVAHSLNDSVSIPVKITGKAKSEILEKKGFPLCLEYYKEFEDKATKIAKNKTEDGIQSLGNNNKKLRKKYKQEIKISYDERLYSTEQDYVFDEFGSGLHKLKSDKA